MKVEATKLQKKKHKKSINVIIYKILHRTKINISFTEFNSGSSQTPVIEVLKANDNGISGKNIINMLMKDTITRLDTKKIVNKV